MFASMRNKKKNRESPSVGEGAARTDQQQSQPSRRKDAVPEPLKLPSPLRYYPGTQMPMDGWFHACRCVYTCASDSLWDCCCIGKAGKSTTLLGELPIVLCLHAQHCVFVAPFCRLCRCWTAFSATATTGEIVPLCRRWVCVVCPVQLLCLY